MKKLFDLWATHRRDLLPATKNDLDWRTGEIRFFVEKIYSFLENISVSRNDVTSGSDEIRPYIERIHAYVENVNFLFGDQYSKLDILRTAALIASFESAEYFTKNMRKSKNFTTKYDLLTHALSIKKAGGLILEFGVAGGKSINHISALTGETVFGFDSFLGLPEDWITGLPKGMFSQEHLPKVNRNVELIVGLFEETLPGFCQRTEGEHVSLLHVDCDLYSSTKTIFKFLKEKIVPGTVIVFDEYFNYRGWQQDEFRAFQEFCAENSVKYTYDSFVSSSEQVCVIIDGAG